MIGSLLYLMLGMWPDICHAVTTMARFSANPTQDHLDHALYICQYLLGTPHYTLQYSGAGDGGLMAFADSNWGQSPDNRRTVTGYMIKLSGGVFNWYSHMQKTVALSSTEAEYMALSDCARQCVWIQQLLQELGIIIRPVPICGDNQGSIFMAQNPVQECRSKDIDIKYHYVHELIAEGKIALYFEQGTLNPVDMFTKNLGRVPFYRCLESLGLTFFEPFRRLVANTAVRLLH